MEEAKRRGFLWEKEVVYEDRARRYVCERFRGGKGNKFADREERSVIIFYTEMDIITDKHVWSVIIK